MLGFEEDATPTNTLDIKTPPKAWKTIMNVTSAALRAAGESSAAYVGPDAISVMATFNLA